MKEKTPAARGSGTERRLRSAYRLVEAEKTRDKRFKKKLEIDPVEAETARASFFKLYLPGDGSSGRARPSKKWSKWLQTAVGYYAPRARPTNLLGLPAFTGSLTTTRFYTSAKWGSFK